MKLCLVLLLLGVSVTAFASPVGEALDRPAMATQNASRSVILSAASAGDRVVAVGERGVILLSDDHGGHWRQAKVPVSVTLTAVTFSDAQHGVAVGHGGTVLTTMDAGESWVRKLDGRAIIDIVRQAVQASGDPKAIQEAQLLQADGPDKPLLDVLPLGPDRLLVVGAYGLAFETEDGGSSWSSWMDRLGNPKRLHLYAARSRGNEIVVAGEQGLVRRSTDGGKTFATVPSPYRGSFFTLLLPAENEIVLAGLRGNVWRSTDAGAVWSQIQMPAPVSITGSTLGHDGSLVLVDQAGTVFAGHGDRFAPIQTPPLPPANAVLAETDGRLLIATIRGVYPVAKAEAGQ